ncbi:hypothetical protein [Nitrosomonas aestuarii]|uniref:hypothetical protein n=1 Tax=Nitrosomonas aestuarii TaxID=52441 RepID=UPI000D304BDA|nr:hypothetical protein [Nitrosomonas aestuarii]PTN13326.1 hypothetical protein C8R11_101319 [Nitrosomonas aestuarii]
MEWILKNFRFFFLILVLPFHSASATSTQSDEKIALQHFTAKEASLDELDNARGREGIDITALNNLDVSATLTGNTANNNLTGTNMIDASAFTGASGMFSVIQNTGNNVIIQDSTIVNVTILP